MRGAQRGMGQLNVLLFGLAFKRCHRQSASEDRGDNDILKSCKTDVMLIVIKKGYIKSRYFFSMLDTLVKTVSSNFILNCGKDNKRNDM